MAARALLQRVTARGKKTGGISPFYFLVVGARNLLHSLSYLLPPLRIARTAHCFIAACCSLRDTVPHSQARNFFCSALTQHAATSRLIFLVPRLAYASFHPAVASPLRFRTPKYSAFVSLLLFRCFRHSAFGGHVALLCADVLP